jgi:hypothetical protein
MAEDSAGVDAQPDPGKVELPPRPRESIETDAKVKDDTGGQVTDEQWKAMFDVVMVIYDYREQE